MLETTNGENIHSLHYTLQIYSESWCDSGVPFAGCIHSFIYICDIVNVYTVERQNNVLSNDPFLPSHVVPPSHSLAISPLVANVTLLHCTHAYTQTMSPNLQNENKAQFTIIYNMLAGPFSPNIRHHNCPPLKHSAAIAIWHRSKIAAMKVSFLPHFKAMSGASYCCSECNNKININSRCRMHRLARMDAGGQQRKRINRTTTCAKFVGKCYTHLSTHNNSDRVLRWLSDRTISGQRKYEELSSERNEIKNNKMSQILGWVAWHLMRM